MSSYFHLNKLIKNQNDYYINHYEYNFGKLRYKKYQLPEEQSSDDAEEVEAVAEAERKSRNDRTNHTKFDIEYRVLTKNGEYHWFRSVGEYERWIDGMPYRFTGIFVDVNDQHETITADQER